MTPFLYCLNGMSSVPAWRFSLLQAGTHSERLPAALTNALSDTAVHLTLVGAVCLSCAWPVSAGWHPQDEDGPHLTQQQRQVPWPEPGGQLQQGERTTACTHDLHEQGVPWVSDVSARVQAA